jgi:hypothetical protein
MHRVPVVVCMKEDEQDLHKKCIHSYLEQHWSMVAHEWEVIPGKPEDGKGDLVFEKEGAYMVMECKRRNNAKVREQAQFYAAAWKLRYAKPRSTVFYGIWTCSTHRVLGSIRSKKDAVHICKRDVCHYL